MLNRTNAAVSEALDARRAISAELRERLRELPLSPFDWDAFDPATALRVDGGSADLCLVALSRLLCLAPARTAELRALWNESVITAAFALRLAPHLGGDASSSAIAALLHRLGDMLTIRAIAEIECSSRMRLDAMSKSDLCAEYGVSQLERVVRAWNVAPRAAATAAQWRQLCEFPGASADAATVYLARLFAIELISPQFTAPGVVELALEEAGLDPAAIVHLRSDPAIASLLTR